MEDVFDAAWQGQAARNTTIEAELASLIDVYGLPVLAQPTQIRKLLGEAFPQAQHRVAAILAALEADVPERLRGAKADERLPSLLQGSARHLQDQGSLDAASALWAVRAWAHALALPLTGLPDAVDPVAPAPVEAGSIGAESIGRGSSAAELSASPGPPAKRVDAPAAGRVPAQSFADGDSTIARTGRLPPLPAAGAGSLRPGGVTSGPIAPFGGSNRLPRTTKAGAPRTEPALKRALIPQATAASPTGDTSVSLPPTGRLADRGVSSAADPVANPVTSPVISPVINPVINPDTRSVADPILVEPLFTDHDLERIARDGAHHEPVGVDRPAAIVALSATRTSATTSGIFAGSRPEDGPDGGPLPSPGASDLPPRQPYLEPARRVWRPVAIGSALLVVALATWFAVDASRPDRRRAPAVAAIAPSDAPPTSAARPTTPAAGPTSDIATPSGTGPSTGSAGGDVPGHAEPSAVQDARTLGEPAVADENRTTPATSSPSGSNGGSIDAARPVIARIDVPRVVEGAPFTVVLRLASDVREIAAVERRVVQSSGSWPGDGSTQRVEPRRAGSGALLVSFRAVEAPARATVEFTAVGRDGSRSEPKNVTLAVAEPSLAVGASASNWADCTAATCGAVVEAHELESGFATRETFYQIVVRMDDRQTRVFTAPYRLQAGSRVRLAGDRFVPTASGAAR